MPGQDLRYAVRMMRRAPGFTSIAVLSLALGIGANTAIFSLVNTVILKTLPVREPRRLVELLHRFPGEPHLNGFSWGTYNYFLDHNHVLSGLIGTTRPPSPGGSYFQVRGEGLDAARVDGAYVTGSYFPVLGVRPALGRLIGPEDDQVGRPAAVAVVSWSWWKNRFNLDPAVVGKRIVVDQTPLTIVGVAAREFSGLVVESRQDLWVPLAELPVMHPERSYVESRGGDLTLVGRLKPGVSIEQAVPEMAILYRQALAQEPNTGSQRFQRAMRFEMEPAGAGLSAVRDRYGKPLVILMAVVGLLLLIACTNVVSLLLARGAARQREIALRVSLGASRLRLMRQVVTESVLLSLAGTVPGVLLAYFGTDALVRVMASGREPIELHVAPDARVLLFTAGLAVITAVVFGLAPAFGAWAAAPASSLREAGRGGETRMRRLFGRSLVAAQVALSLVLLAAAGLFVRHLSSIYSGLGFQRDRVLLVTLDPSRGGYRREQLAGPYRQLLERLAGIPGVRSATLSAVTPVQGAGRNRDVTVEGYQPKPGELRYMLENWVAPKYFETLGTPLLMGRDFSFKDEGRPRVAIINQYAARYYFGAASPLGKHIRFDGEDRPYEIVGVAANAQYLDTHEVPGRIIYLNAFQEGRIMSQFSLRTSIAPGSVAMDVRRAVAEVLKNVPVARVRTLAEQVDATIVPERLIVMLSGWFGMLGAVLAAIGIYGLLAYTVARRINEIGIRMALGATRADVSRMVLRDAFGMVAAGLLVGVPAALWAGRIAASLLEGLRVGVGPSLALGAAVLVCVALAAAWAPALWAARVDPMEALRHE
jgi:putative ABC transport system permease protein